MTGNRNATEQAITRTHAFATAVAEAGRTVTATLAYGVDAAAHPAAAQAGRAPLAILLRGLDPLRLAVVVDISTASAFRYARPLARSSKTTRHLE